MTTRRTSARHVKKEIANVGVDPQGNQATPKDNHAPPQVQAPVIPPPMKDGDINSPFLSLAQAMTTQSQAVDTQAQSMTTQANWEV